MASEWEDRLARWQAELDLFARLEDTPWVPLAQAEAETGVSRSALRSWYRNGEIPSRLMDGPNGPQRLVPLDAVIERAAQSPRLQRRAEREVSLEAQVALLRHRVDQLELRLAALDRTALPPPGPGAGPAQPHEGS
jgi:transposase